MANGSFTYLDSTAFVARMQELLEMVDDIARGTDTTLRALKGEADKLGVSLVAVGGVAVIRHGYERTTKDRDVLVSYKHAKKLGTHLWDHTDWERLEIAEYAFVYRPTGVKVDFLVGRDLMTLGQPYYFPEPDEVEKVSPIEQIPVVGLHDLLYFKLLAGRMQDLADMMQLIKLHLNEIVAERILSRLDPLDEERKANFLEILRDAPKEIADERRLGQGITFTKEQNQYRPKRNKDGS
jgi:hypothetical protein